jgi:hypothetical protein
MDGDASWALRGLADALAGLSSIKLPFRPHIRTA